MQLKSSTQVVINRCHSDTSDFTHLCWIAVRIAAVRPVPNRNGSRRFDHFEEWLRKNGCRAAAWYQRTSKSGSGSSRNPPTSAATKEQFTPLQPTATGKTNSSLNVRLPPQKDIPARLRDKSIGMVIFRCSQLAVLSPVHTAPV